MNITQQGASPRSPAHISRCVVCGGAGGEPVWDVAKSPIHPFRPPEAAGSQAGFGCLHIVRCDSCGHLYNAAFDPLGADDLYGAFVLTNVPVSPSMVKAVEGTAESILRHAKPRPVVLEVGGGGGALSMLLAETASEVHLVEPSRALSPDRFAGTKVTFHQSMFPTTTLTGKVFDVIVCRQVLEHIPDPNPFLKSLRAQISDDGIAYIELPSAEYIYVNRSVVDFHYPHVHFYRQPHLEALFARAGFAVVETIDVKNGHDTAFVLRPVAASDVRPAIIKDDPNFVADMAKRRAYGRERLTGITGSIGLYGANAYSQSLFGVYPDFAAYSAMFDDTPMYVGHQVYGPAIDLPIGPPSVEKLLPLGAVIVTAYLHDLVIARKVRALGFKGPIYTVRTDSLAGNGEQPPSLFA
ncbi:methyltransferase domain-containing protein [Pseudolabrys taiwanensis]|uniref:Methyltransferase domain-containing protein n=1 Tax=Pseudolabrys taiwanensis TaxID=331696 RepID=A0A345ZQ57_9HYPH|nr:class I SAM-dependent methyltransferase [Pseudolabrys taiwanensis]AXK79054.1 methyltransferase domain-containing protein [Pseudolabrys taiwanensis]